MPSQKTRVKSRRRSSKSQSTQSPRWIGILLTLTIVCVGIVVVGFLTMQPKAADGFVSVQSSARVKLPEDEGPHDHATEWWYYNGHLTDEAGGKFSYHVSFFAHRSMVSHTIINVSLLDHQTMLTKTHEARIPGFVSQRDSNGVFKIDAQAWKLILDPQTQSLNGTGSDFAMDLQLEVAGPLVMQDDDGAIEFAAAGDSYYYSRSRMPTTGNIEIDGTRYTVTGDSWYDHQWGDYRANVLSWEWFALQLDDGADIMVFALRDFNDEDIYIGGTYTQENTTTKLARADINMSVLGYWESAVTQVSYPVSWKFEIPSFELSLMLLPVKRDSEFDARKSSYNAYWEGPMVISGSHSGQGFLEVSRAISEIATPK